jgi:hypothetical protein
MCLYLYGLIMISLLSRIVDTIQIDDGLILWSAFWKVVSKLMIGDTLENVLLAEKSNVEEINM